jgi:asparagine synthase (glutamine-hydrolysing)
VKPEDVTSPYFSHLPRWRLTSRLKLLLSRPMRAELSGYDSVADLTSRLPERFAEWDGLNQAQYLEMVQLLPGYILSAQGDRVAMAHGVEGRFPFLDPDVVAFGSRLPSTLKLRRLEEKYLLKQYARTVLSTPVWRRPKQPYRAPAIKAFFSGRSSGYIDHLLSFSQLQRDGVFDPHAVDLLVTKCREGRATSEKDNMAFVGVLSTQIMLDRFVNHFEVIHGSAHGRTAEVHHG